MITVYDLKNEMITCDIEEKINDLFNQCRIGDKDHLALFAKKAFSRGEILCPFGAAAKTDTPNYLTVQVSTSSHISLFPEILQYINHSCDPNVFFDVNSSTLRALKDISEGEEITFFYPSTEWEMDQPFECWCGAERCLKQIQGAAFLPQNILRQYELNEHIRILAQIHHS